MNNDIVDLFDEWLHACGRSPKTRDLRRYQISRLCAVLDVLTCDEHDISWFFSFESWGRATRRSFFSAFRVFFDWLVASGWRLSSPLDGLPAPRAVSPCPRPAPEWSVSALLDGARPDVRLMAGLAAFAGLRRGEIACCHRDDLLGDPGAWWLVVHGKGGKDRLVPIPGWIGDAVSLHPRGFIFPGAIDGHLSAEWVGRLLSRSLPDRVTAHSLRHRFATVAYGRSHDLLAVQKVLGHSRPETTLAYVALADDSLRYVVEVAS